MSNLIDGLFQQLGSNVLSRAIRFYKTPTFLILGAEGAGKRSVVDSVCRNVLMRSELTGGPRLTLTDEACYIEVNTKDDLSFIKKIKRMRFYRPIDGVIVVSALGLDDRGIRAQLEIMMRLNKASIPLYTVVTGLDGVGGFKEFTAKLSKEESAYPFGLKPTLSKLDRDIKNAVNILSKRAAQQLNYTSTPLHNVANVLFPGNFGVYRDKLTRFCQSAFVGHGCRVRLNFNGLFFSAKNEGTTLFSSQLFERVFSWQKDENRWAKRIERNRDHIWRWSVFFLAPILTILFSMVMWGYSKNMNAIQKAEIALRGSIYEMAMRPDQTQQALFGLVTMTGSLGLSNAIIQENSKAYRLFNQWSHRIAQLRLLKTAFDQDLQSIRGSRQSALLAFDYVSKQAKGNWFALNQLIMATKTKDPFANWLTKYMQTKLAWVHGLARQHVMSQYHVIQRSCTIDRVQMLRPGGLLDHFQAHTLAPVTDKNGNLLLSFSSNLQATFNHIPEARHMWFLHGKAQTHFTFILGRPTTAAPPHTYVPEVAHMQFGKNLAFMFFYGRTEINTYHWHKGDAVGVRFELYKKQPIAVIEPGPYAMMRHIDDEGHFVMQTSGYKISYPMTMAGGGSLQALVVPWRVCSNEY